jgi:RAT1-interacting protein
VWDQRPNDPNEPINWVELKTTQELHSDADSLKFERKLCKFWIQSFLLGVPKIVVGFRSREGILQRVQELQTQKIPGEVKRKGSASWDGNLCISFTAEVLEFLKGTITSEGVWKIRRSQRSPTLEVFKVEPSGTGDILTTEFLEWRNQLYAREVAAMLG